MTPEPIVGDATREFRRLKDLAEKAVAQVTGENLFTTLDEDSNSIAFLIKHLAGNMRSRWTDFLTSDGEKPNRRRDSEFLAEPEDTRENLFERWEAGWSCVFEALGALSPEDMKRTVTIRGEPHSVPQAIQRHLVHAAYHVGQIVFLAKHFAGSKWQSLSIPRGKSEQFSGAMRRKQGEA